MRRRFKKILEKAKSLSALSSEEKESMRAALFEHMSAHPITSESGSFEIAKPVSYISWVGNYFHGKKMIVPSALLLLMMLMTGVCFASSSALPGNFLYPIKLLNEKIDSVLTFDPIKKAKVGAEIAMNRLKEAESLFVSGKLDEKTETELADSFETNYNSVDSSLIVAEESDKQSSTIAAQEFSNDLYKHKQILKSLVNLEGNDAKNNILTNKVDNAIAKLNVSMDLPAHPEEIKVEKNKIEIEWSAKQTSPAYSIKVNLPPVTASAALDATTTESNSASTTEESDVEENTEVSHQVNTTNANNTAANESATESHANTGASIKTPIINIETHASNNVKTPSLGL